MGKYAARCVANNIADELIDLDFVFMNFSHCTHFFGFRTVLLGLYNGQSLPDSDTEYLMRITPNDEYIKIVVYENKVMVEFENEKKIIRKHFSVFFLFCQFCVSIIVIFIT